MYRKPRQEFVDWEAPKATRSSAMAHLTRRDTLVPPLPASGITPMQGDELREDESCPTISIRDKR